MVRVCSKCSFQWSSRKDYQPKTSLCSGCRANNNRNNLELTTERLHSQGYRKGYKVGYEKGFADGTRQYSEGNQGL